ncbi:XtrA/YqaO family protein [Bacillus safensis]|nr:XtrA/YqaO family protein [Bacillus safensis]MCY7466494.1 XtrA/YqaO family protein [Bacillus safensis]MDP4564614.1 XtrA/YqaO family protein [Bacillus safensis]MEC0921990.1 XtrA/YqaO family protein [Bacillus safensis]MEC0985415.1 XtrA/YqaO family protein [Bacillus safensis]MEC0994133.1 XtrA/YqaO family protein [Bacillus safensis]
MKPTEIKDFETTIQNANEADNVRIIVIDGNEGTAHITDAPEHGKTIIQTAKGHFVRVEHEIGYKIK